MSGSTRPKGPRLDDIEGVLAWLATFTDWEQKHARALGRRSLDLERMRRLCTRLGDPERRFPCVHVAGTKGKGTTVTTTERLVAAHGLRTGRFISPHLEHVTERIALDGRPIDATRFCALARRLSEMLGDPSEIAPEDLPSFFEAMTLFAFLAFSEAEVDLAVLEVGLGGRLDATNVVLPEVSVVTTLDLEHTRVLGDTLDEIGGEKAGILKPGRPAVSASPRESEGGRVIAARARELDCELLVLGEEIRIESDRRLPGGGRVIDLAIRERRFPELGIRLAGRGLVEDAALAVTATVLLEERGRLTLDETRLRETLARLEMPGRLELFPPGDSCPEPLLLDCAHTPASMAALARTVRELLPRGPRVLVVGILSDKRAEDCLRPLAGLFDRVLAVAPETPRARTPAETAAAARRALPGVPVEALEELSELRTRLRSPGGSVVVAGSIYLAGHVRPWIAGPPPTDGL